MPETTPTTLGTVPSLYDTDFYAWTQQQALLLRDEQWNQLDRPNLIEEITALGKQQRQAWRQRLSVLLGHLLKWEYQPHRRSRSWLATLRIQRLDLAELLEDNPSLSPYLAEAIAKAYLKGVELAIEETDLPRRTVRQHCPYSVAEILADGFYPGAPSAFVEELDS